MKDPETIDTVHYKDKSKVLGKIDIIAEALSSQASPEACYAGALFLIGNALHKAVTYTDKGPVYTNLSFFNIAPSSNDKTPLIRVMYEVYQRLLKPEGMHFKSKFTTEGLMNKLNEHRKKYESKGEKVPVYRCMVMRDEASSLPKESHGRGANIYEFLGQAFDNDLMINPYDSVRGQEQEFPEVWFSFWFSSTLTIYRLLNDDFWEQGIAFRSLFTRPEKAGPYLRFSTDDTARQIAVETIVSELIPLLDIEKVEKTRDWWELYNPYREKIRLKGDQEIDSLSNGQETPMELKADKKYPELVVKLSMIHCASREGWVIHDGKKVLLMTSEDLIKAIKDLDRFRENFLFSYNAYLRKKSAPMRLEKIQELRDMIRDVIEKAPKEFRYVPIPGEVDKSTGQQKIYAGKNPEGNYVCKSYLYKKFDYTRKSLNEILATLSDAEEIEVIEAFSYGTNRKTILIGIPEEIDLNI